MNKLGKLAAMAVISYLVFKVIAIRPIRNYLLGTAVDTTYYLIKKKLK